MKARVSLSRKWTAMAAANVFALAVLLGTGLSFPIASGLAYASGDPSPAAATLQARKEAPKVLILYASIGNGHFSASKAIAEEIKKKYPDAEIILKDARDFQNPLKRMVVNYWYDFSTKFRPSGYDAWYQSLMKEGESIDSLGNLPAVKNANTDGYLAFINKVKPTMIITTQNHITEVIHHLRDKGELRDIPIAQVLTDYTPTGYFRRLGDKTEMTFVPAKQIEQKFIAEGMPASKVRTAGIPVNPKFWQPYSASEREAFLRSQNLDPKVTTVLVTSGSAGVGNYQTMVESIAKDAKGPIQIVAVTGRSSMNLKRLNKLLSSGTLPPNVKLKVTGLIPQDEMMQYLKSSDVVVGKSGGLTSTEIAVLGKRAVFLDINGGQERYNSEFFQEHHLGLTTHDLNLIGPLVNRLLTDKQLDHQIQLAQQELRSNIKPELIAQWVEAEMESPTVKAELHPVAPRGPPVAAAETTEEPRATAPAKAGNAPKAAFIDDEREVAAARMQLYEGAHDQIYANYYLHDGNKSGMVHFAELRDAALRMKAEGKKPEVKLIIDAWGPEKWVDAAINPAIIKALEEAGVEVRIFNPVDLKSNMTYLNPNNFKRTHEKTVVIDHRYVVSGDRNVQNINFRLQKTAGKTGLSYKSVETVVDSPTVADEATRHYLNQFNNPLSKPIDTSAVTPEQLAQATRNLDRYSRLIHGRSFEALKHSFDLEERMVPVKSVSFIHDVVGPDGYKVPGKGTEEILQNLVKNSTGAVRLTSPYFNPISEWMKIIEDAKKEGRDIRIQTVAQHATDVPLTVKFLEPKAKELMAKGIPVLQFQGPDIAHAKIVQVGQTLNPTTGKPEGERMTAIVSHNINRRSGWTDYESGFLIEGNAFAKEVDEFNHRLEEGSKPFAPPADRSTAECLTTRILQSVQYLPIVRDQL